MLVKARTHSFKSADLSEYEPCGSVKHWQTYLKLSLGKSNEKKQKQISVSHMHVLDTRLAWLPNSDLKSADKAA